MPLCFEVSLMDKDGMCGHGNDTCMHACFDEGGGPHPPTPAHPLPSRRPPERMLRPLQKKFEAWVRACEAMAKKHGNGWEITFRMKHPTAKSTRHHTQARLAWAMPEPGHGHRDLHRTLRKGLKGH